MGTVMEAVYTAAGVSYRGWRIHTRKHGDGWYWIAIGQGKRLHAHQPARTQANARARARDVIDQRIAHK